MSRNHEASLPLDAEHLDQIIDKMVYAVEDSKTQIFEIGEQSREEHDALVKELEVIKHQVHDVIDRYDTLERDARLARGHLAKVSSHFNTYQEADIRAAYERANSIQVELSIVQEMERQLKIRRNDIERRITKLKATVDKADKLVGQVSVVLNYLTGDLQKMGEMIESAKEKQAFGLKIIEAQEEERKRLSREIHDGPAQILARVLIGSDIVERVHRNQGPEASAKELLTYREMVRSALAEVRRIIYDLRPMTLDDLGLIPTLKKYLSQVENQFKGLKVHFNCIGHEHRVSSNMEVALFRLCQEGVQNACKHAEASFIKVIVEFKEKQIVLLIKDNGKGFDPEQSHTSKFGLMGMKERVELLKGKWTLNSEPKVGTSIIINIPIIEEEEH
ncbi:histidine kinase [Terrilactibacillus sp. BCM23-1]|uniref:Signal transduction histidine-protein kinase/phosphatase DegS n=1 Tax=Terrilactibacillus tamarindi TaxID=2599694 RepID=A0A6N8CNJ9_9BACI|nr:sensor histidine kinase [Terrilactibacillus tamarindi]MTT31551.1 histidine kinase [Terrilactibacillus tamarindi]